jgi:hypothetical protein
MNEMLADKVPNIRILALKCICSNKKLLNKTTESTISKMREDSDIEIRQIAR